MLSLCTCTRSKAQWWAFLSIRGLSSKKNDKIDTKIEYTNFERTRYPKKLLGRTFDSGFVDLKWIKVSSGSGGDGGIHFWRSSQNPKGPPSGGNGGKGGNVYIRASKEVTSLGGILNSYKAQSGGSGTAKTMHGADGKDVEIVLPVGTCVRQVDSPHAQQLQIMQAELEEKNKAEGGDQVPSETVDEEVQWDNDFQEVSRHFKFKTGYLPHQDRLEFLKEKIPPPIPPQPPICLDLSEHGQRHLIMKGGRGGFGNPHFVTEDIKGPPVAGKGEAGTSVWLELELKSLADAGLVGLPNAGKSTLLSRISNANPKIAPYPFTTLNPYIGTIDFPDFYTMTVADIPGLIDGAHKNIGLGHTFLRHIERSRVLVYVIDLSGAHPEQDFLVLRKELEAYSSQLISKPSMVIANKADLKEKAKANLPRLVEIVGPSIAVVPVSALDDKNIEMALAVLRGIVQSQESD
ncbi:hypothetical protein HDU97_008085 [Phlyctochytrium planicorne]|nr:hypothetical protein HDU97_008085 [Phlyctochytrium planicorne]